ncbi:hypothetical protein [Yersinia enterocolitica]|uniref:hypothetical protein n=1 Tax=Yersinia enterocolitica TaxID=630 RepID=UPI001C608D7E|nr:hypothetical protein [Yersinia enterocolitica]EKN4770562.1 hypothetical protein [Yersinia enterocolitica]MBW5821215.1 hypothetical protein [Yersinia enterocolitica]MBW5868625.1 hypothetical protein [Yersinia enterocolitica]MBW5879412.1 hypothetical protein [Yersinia enterocolitica]MBX9477497.1 hypothetical protein [Yersinia enterocolitica]
MTPLLNQWCAATLRPAAINITCSQICLHPWSGNVGNVTPSGRYLSPTNAVAALAPYLSGVSGQQEMVAMLICAPSLDAFLTLADQFADAFPLPEIRRMSRMARTQLSLATTRMQRPARASNGLPPPTTLSVDTARHLARTAQIAQATQSGTGGINQLTAALNQFKQARAQALAAITQGSQSLQQHYCPVWAFCSTGDIQTARTDIQENIPHPEQVFSALALFIGPDLSALRGALT